MEDEDEDANVDLHSPLDSMNSSQTREEIPEKRPKKSVNKKRSDVVDEKLLEILNQPPPTPKQQDEVELFLLSLAPQMRRLTQRQQTAAKVQMLTILSNLELQEFRQPNQTPSPPVNNSFEGGSLAPNMPWEPQAHYTSHFRGVRPWENYEL